VSDPLLDALAEGARNRGLKLIRSRVRTPGKRRFGKVGLTDPSGKPVFGMDAKGATGDPGEVEEYLRNLGAEDWGASLNVAVMPRTAKAPTKNKGAPARETKRAAPPPAPPSPTPPPNPKIREAKAGDAARLVELIHELGHEIDEKSVRKNIKTLTKSGEAPLVATLGKSIVGMVGRHVMVTVHRPAPVGRIPALIVAKEAQGLRLGRILVEAVEEWCRSKGCQLIEVTSNDRRTEAHAFYRHLGYERSSIRFFKKL
jgi:GNAT superfamily N-acetyltransferase